MDTRTFLSGTSALLILLSVVSCGSGSYSGSSSKSCTNGDCTVTINGTGASGDLTETDRVEYEYRIVLQDDRSAEVELEREVESRREVRSRRDKNGNRHKRREKVSEREEEEESVVRVGETTRLHEYTVDYVSNNGDGATFEFTRRR